MKEYQILGACGLYCGACNHYRYSCPDGEYLLINSNPRNLSSKDFQCKGCHSDLIEILPGCARCKIRRCAELKWDIHCGQCDKYPCGLLIEFQYDGRPHHEDVKRNLRDIKMQGIIQWLIEQERKWKCTCGFSYSWYEKICYKCGKSLDSYRKEI